MAKIITPTLAKLFAIRIVASNCFGLDKKSFISFALFVFLDFILMRSSGLRAKKATSEPEIRADAISKPIRAIIISISSGPTGFKNNNFGLFIMGSGVKVYFFNETKKEGLLLILLEILE